MAEIGAEGMLPIPQVTAEKKKKESFGTPESPAAWMERTENDKSLKNYLTFGRRMQMLVRSSLGDEKAVEGSFNAFKEWARMKSDPDKYYSSLGEEMRQAGLTEKSLMDMGAGAGAALGLFENAGVFPKRLILVEPNRDYYEFINDRVAGMCADRDGQSGEYELVDSGDVAGEERHRTYHIKNRRTGQEFEVETMNRLAGRDEIKPAGDAKVDAVTFSGVAKYYEPGDFRHITDSLKPVLNENGRISFSFTLEDAPGLDTRLHKMIKGGRSEHPYTQKHMEELFSRKCSQNYGDNYVCTL